jgi:uncharacterized protein DUF4160
VGGLVRQLSLGSQSDGVSVARNRVLRVPRISSFYGISILMYFNDHDPPHFHAEYGEHRARIGIGSLEPLDAGLPSRATHLIREWATLHRLELMLNWKRAREGRPLVKIDPLP